MATHGLLLVLLAVLVVADANETTLDVHPTPKCLPTAPPTVRIVQARILQVRQYHRVEVFTCRVDSKTDFFTCQNRTRFDIFGKKFIWSEESLVASLPTHRVLGSEGCRHLHTTKKYEDPVVGVIDIPDPDRTSSKTSQDVHCSPGGVSSGVRNETSVKRGSTSVSVAQNSTRIKMPWGEECDYELGYCQAKSPDGEWLEGWWDIFPRGDCEAHEYDALTSGVFTLTTSHDNETFVTSVTAGTFGIESVAFRLVNRTRVCDDEAYATDHARIIVAVSEDGNFTLGRQTHYPAREDHDPEAIPRARLAFAEATVRLGAAERRRQDDHVRCLAEQLALNDATARAEAAEAKATSRAEAKATYAVMLAGLLLVLGHCVVQGVAFRRLLWELNEDSWLLVALGFLAPGLASATLVGSLKVRAARDRDREEALLPDRRESTTFQIKIPDFRVVRGGEHQPT